MSFRSQSLCVLGRQPALGLAELESLYGHEHIQPAGNCALLDLDVNDLNFKRLGGTIKLAKVLNILPTTRWSELEKYLIDSVPQHLQYVPEGKFTLGVSLYGLGIDPRTINTSLLKLKKVIKATGRPVRIVPNKEPELNSAQVLHNKLTTKGGWELLFVRHGSQTILAQTMFVQDIEAYGARDQARPQRDSRVGMLPPKLAQIIINLANPPDGGWVLDPFCGSGVVLQEALLMGFRALGTDIDERMVEFSKTNIEWLRRQKSDLPEADIFKADALSAKWPAEIDAVASEVYLGPPLKNSQLPAGLPAEIGRLVEAFLKNIAPQLKTGTRLALAIPAWPQGGKPSFITPAIGKLTEMGYNHIKFHSASEADLIYWRSRQAVGRKLIVLKKV